MTQKQLIATAVILLGLSPLAQADWGLWLSAKSVQCHGTSTITGDSFKLSYQLETPDQQGAQASVTLHSQTTTGPVLFGEIGVGSYGADFFKLQGGVKKDLSDQWAWFIYGFKSYSDEDSQTKELVSTNDFSRTYTLKGSFDHYDAYTPNSRKTYDSATCVVEFFDWCNAGPDATSPCSTAGRP